MGKQKIGRLYDHLGYWHNRFGRLIDERLEQRLTEHGELTVSQWYVLALLYHREADSIAAIAAALPIDPAEASRLVARLEFKKLVARKVDPTDPHSARLKLTRKGGKLAAELAAAADENERALFGELSGEEIARYKTLLAKLLRAQGEEPRVAADGDHG